MVRQIFICCIFFLLCGCALQPKYYSYDYTDVRLDGIDIEINSVEPYGVTAFLDGEEVELVNVRSRGHEVWCNGKRSMYYCDRGGSYHPVAARVKRDSQEHELRLKRPGYQDIVFRLSPQYTNELWSEGHNEWFGRRESNHWHMLLPYNTVAGIGVSVVAMVAVPKYLVKGNFIKVGKHIGYGIAAIPVGLVQDIYNIVIGIPSVYIINPWTNYKLDVNPLETPVEWVK
ncbi:MAG: hypothetical protein J6L86_07175 [Alphaproteobacteria bacterium]|nr:hypothetical protein [Alphaproteobacteria bacterium]